MLFGIRKPKRYAVFISGNGSTLQSLLEMHDQINIQLVVFNKKNKLGELKAKRFGKSAVYLSKEYTFEQLHVELIKNNINAIFLAGFMKLLPKEFVQVWNGRIFNIHPSLLPEFPGLNSLENNFHAKTSMGVTIHEVNEQMDQGRVFLQSKAIDLEVVRKISLVDANTFVRRTEQHLLREFVIRKAL
ncbi:MAG: formyltransferase family protein [Pseudobdellovibrio sp.]